MGPPTTREPELVGRSLAELSNQHNQEEVYLEHHHQRLDRLLHLELPKITHLSEVVRMLTRVAVCSVVVVAAAAEAFSETIINNQVLAVYSAVARSEHKVKLNHLVVGSLALPKAPQLHSGLVVEPRIHSVETVPLRSVNFLLRSSLSLLRLDLNNRQLSLNRCSEMPRLRKVYSVLHPTRGRLFSVGSLPAARSQLEVCSVPLRSQVPHRLLTQVSNKLVCSGSLLNPTSPAEVYSAPLRLRRTHVASDFSVDPLPHRAVAAFSEPRTTRTRNNNNLRYSSLE